ncbi:hypothetical protein I551_8922 [Mycobacterium ulcerans str. Harvey]|uniref:Uncharacterized protein n=1 Tax=Mycobacterium ulcerans str. Harvey TaxID=1299332 RepID=A0ABN0R9N5_MYCUL|nr:hypothetical protein I551_8922 [Mycobacterium ulcerans str. Harvey]
MRSGGDGARAPGSGRCRGSGALFFGNGGAGATVRQGHGVGGTGGSAVLIGNGGDGGDGTGARPVAPAVAAFHLRPERVERTSLARTDAAGSNSREICTWLRKFAGDPHTMWHIR